MDNAKEELERMRHTLRLIYADLTERAKRSKYKAETAAQNGKKESAIVFGREAYIHSADASRVKFYCHRIGFDPSEKGGEHVSLQQKSEDA